MVVSMVNGKVPLRLPRNLSAETDFGEICTIPREWRKQLSFPTSRIRCILFMGSTGGTTFYFYARTL